MSEKAQQIAAIYEREIENLKWHLKTNGELLKEDEKTRTLQRIQDRQVFLIYLKVL